MDFDDMLYDRSFRIDSELQYLIGSYYESIAESEYYYVDEYMEKALWWYKKAIENGHGQAEIAVKRVLSSLSSFEEDHYFSLESIVGNEYVRYYDLSNDNKFIYIQNKHGENYLLVFISDPLTIVQRLDEILKEYKNEKPFVICCADSSSFVLKEEFYNCFDDIDLFTIGSFSETFISLISICSFGDNGVLCLSVEDLKSIKDISQIIEIYVIEGKSYSEISDIISREDNITTDKNRKIVMNFDNTEDTSISELSKINKAISPDSAPMSIGYNIDSPYTDKTVIIIKPCL